MLQRQAGKIGRMDDRSKPSAEVVAGCVVAIGFAATILAILLIGQYGLPALFPSWSAPAILIGINAGALILAWVFYRRLPSRW
jgi:hypothetical protein